MSTPPSDMKAYNKRLIADFRATGGRMTGPMEGRRLLVLTTTGARSGEPRTVVNGCRPYGDAYASIASNNGAPTPPWWLHNLRADPNATIEVGPEKLQVKARVAEGEERDRAARVIEYLAPQEAKAGRQIPVVLFEKA